MGTAAGTGLLDTYEAERGPVGRRNATETGTAWKGLRPERAAVRRAEHGPARLGLPVPVEAVAGTAGRTGPVGRDYGPSADPGCRAPHLWLADGRSTIDLFDRGYVLLTAPAGGFWRKSGCTDHVISEPGWPALYGVEPTGAVLVRPDGHVAWRAVDDRVRERPPVSSPR